MIDRWFVESIGTLLKRKGYMTGDYEPRPSYDPGVLHRTKMNLRYYHKELKRKRCASPQDDQG